MSNKKLSAVLEFKDKFSATIKTFKDDTKKAAQQTKNAFKDMYNELQKRQEKYKKHLNTLNSSVKKIELGAAAGITAGAMFIKSAYKDYVELNKQLTRNKAITGANATEQAQLENQVKQLGATTAYTSKEIAEAHMYQAMAGMKVNDILKLTPTLLDLATASGEDLASVSDILTDNLGAFGLATEDAGMFADLLSNIANKSNTTVGMMGSSFKYVGAVSRGFGEDIREVGTMIGILADNGIKGELSGTALRGVYSRLAKITPEMREQFELTNTKLYDSNKKFKGLRKIIEESKPALMKLTEQQRNQWLATVAGTEGMNLWNIIMNSTEEATTKVAKAAYEAEGATRKFAEVVEESDDHKIKLLGSAWDGFKTAIAQAAAPSIREGLEELTKKINGLTSSDTFSPENMKNFFKGLKDNIGTAVKAFVGFKIAVLAVRAAMGDVSAIAALTALGVVGIGYGLATREETPTRDKNKIDSKKRTTSRRGGKNKSGYSGAMNKNFQEEQKEAIEAKEREQIEAGLERKKQLQDGLDFGGGYKKIELNLGGVNLYNGLDIDQLSTSILNRVKTL